jgi:DNA-binding NarL/FixJ family response regulator
VDSRLKSLREFIKRKRRPLGEILYDRKDIRRYLEQRGYTPKYAANFSLMFPNEMIFRSKIDQIIAIRKENRKSSAIKLSKYYNIPRLTDWMRTVMDERAKGMPYKKIAEKYGKSLYWVRETFQRGKERSELKTIAKG